MPLDSLGRYTGMFSNIFSSVLPSLDGSADVTPAGKLFEAEDKLMVKRVVRLMRWRMYGLAAVVFFL